MTNIHQFIKDTAISVGFDVCGIAKAEALPDDEAYMRKWLEEGKNGEMKFLERNFEKRMDPRLLVPGCKSVVVVLFNYFTEKKQPETAPKVARYAYSEVDYHTVIKKKLWELEGKIVDKLGPEIVNNECQHSFVDSAPVLEKRWAQRAGVGWVGKNSQIISTKFGSYCYIGTLMLNIEMQYDEPHPNRCGKCTKCIDTCPVNALDGKSLNAKRCIAYQTIEKKGTVDDEIQPKLSNCILGCDICSNVCPWNKRFAQVHSHSELKPVDEILKWDFADWEKMDQETFEKIFQHSAIKRAGYSKLHENIQLIEKNIKKDK